VTKSYGGNGERLAEAKRLYDPDQCLLIGHPAAAATPMHARLKRRVQKIRRVVDPAWLLMLRKYSF
jgi:hypothetical protein